MQAPGFWSRPPDSPGIAARLLAPLAWIWGLGAGLRRRRGPRWRAPVPVICVGNLTAGGTGKTPMVAALLPRLGALGLAPAVLSRGHGGRLRGPHRVDPGRDVASDVGDEPLLLATLAPVWIASDRIAGARAAVAAGARCLVMDDGFQSPALTRDLSILMVDAVASFGNGRLIPAGPLREPVIDGLARADLVVLVGEDAARHRCLAAWPALGRHRGNAGPLAARTLPQQTGLDLAGLPTMAFAGIGRPSKFFETLRWMGAELVATVPFPDHYAYPPAVVRRLVREARTRGAVLVTTEKDAVRLPPDLRAEVMAVPVRLVLDDWGDLDAHLAKLAAGTGEQDPWAVMPD